MPFDPRKHIIRPPAAGAPQPPRQYAPPKQKIPITSSRRLAAVPGKIDVVPFKEFPDIEMLDLSQYSGVIPLLKRHICSSSELEDAVNTIMLNLMQKSGQKVVQPGKIYDAHEREYNHNQLMEYLHTISCIEIHAKRNGRLGNFSKKETSLIDSQPGYHLAYFDDLIDHGEWSERLSEKTFERTKTIVSLAPKGILLFYPVEGEIDKMKHIGNFGKVGMYQMA
jgi:hypothetical protein